LRQLNLGEESTVISRPSSPIKVVIACSKYKAQLGEGPHWDPESKRLYYVDILGKKVLSLDPTNEDLKIYDAGALVGCLAPVAGKPNTFLVATQRGIQFLNMTSDTMTTLVTRTTMESKPENRFNDGKVDSSGRLWVGTMSTEDKKNQGSLYVVRGDGKFTSVISDVSISNGLAWTADDKKFYYIDTPTQQIVQYDHDKATATISNKKVAFSIPKDLGNPDGMTIDTDGNLWVALWNGSSVVQYNPHTGTLLKLVHIPAPKVTSVCFGGPNLDILYVTTASKDTDLKKFPEAGCVFAVTGLGVKGHPYNKFAASS